MSDHIVQRIIAIFLTLGLSWTDFSALQTTAQQYEELKDSLQQVSLDFKSSERPKR